MAAEGAAQQPRQFRYSGAALHQNLPPCKFQFFDKVSAHGICSCQEAALSLTLGNSAREAATLTPYAHPPCNLWCIRKETSRVLYLCCTADAPHCRHSEASLFCCRRAGLS